MRGSGALLRLPLYIVPAPANLSKLFPGNFSHFSRVLSLPHGGATFSHSEDVYKRQVLHRVFKRGVVVEVLGAGDSQRVRVRFDSGAEKLFFANAAPSAKVKE